MITVTTVVKNLSLTISQGGAVVMDEVYGIGWATDSVNPPSRKAIYDKLESLVLEGTGDMVKSVYDTNNNGKVDSAENADTVNGLTVETAVPLGAVFTDTVYNDTAIQAEVDLNTAHRSNIANPHGVTKTQVGLGSVDNTSDLNKPISTATQSALDTKQATLVSGTNIKTINSTSILGAGDIVISGGGGTMETTTFTPYLTITSTDGQAAVEELKDELDAAVIASGTDVAPMSYTTVGGETTWAIGQTIPSQHKLFINGLKVIEGVDYTITGTTITYIGTILAGETHELFFDIAVPTTYNASETSIADAGGLITATNVEGALQEHRALINANTVKVGVTTELKPTDIDTLAELNAIVTDATLIDTNDARLSDARTPLTHTHDTISGVTITGIPAVGQAPIATSSSTATWQTVSSGGGSSLSTMAEIAAQDFKELISYNKEWILPSYGVNSLTSFNNDLRSSSNVTWSGTSASWDFPINIQLQTGATAGTVSYLRGALLPVIASSEFHFQRGFYKTTTVADERFSIGLSNMYSLSDPTNVEPDTQTNILGICKLSTSDNIHILHNDASGVATTFDLGVEYPANDTTLYYYKLEIFGLLGTSVTVKLTRITRSTGVEINTSQVITTNMPNTDIYAFLWVTNNATAANADIRDRGAIKYLKTF